MIKKRYLFFISQDYSFPILRPLQKEIEAREDEVKWFLYGDEITYTYLQSTETRIYTVEDIIDFNPHAVFVPGNVVPSFIPGLKVEIFHGLPSAKKKKNGQLYHFIIRGMFDVYCTQGENSTKPFEKLAKKYNTFLVKETGWPKLDPLFPLPNENKSTSDQKSIFFASTFSPRFSKAKVLYPFILRMLQQHDYKWYITLHPKMDEQTVNLYKSIKTKKVEFIESIDLIQAFKESSLMLCDTSSIIYEYLTQKKPVITFQTQKDEATLINVNDINLLEEVIIQTLSDLNVNRENIQRSIGEFHPYSDGKSSQRVLDYVENLLQKINQPLKKKPLNIVRNIKLRKELRYWKFNIF